MIRVNSQAMKRIKNDRRECSPLQKKNFCEKLGNLMWRIIFLRKLLRLPFAGRKKLIIPKIEKFSVNRQLNLLSIPKSSCYYQPHRKIANVYWGEILCFFLQISI